MDKNYKYWTQEEINFIKDNYHNMTYKEIAEKLKRSHMGVRSKGRRLFSTNGRKKGYIPTEEHRKNLSDSKIKLFKEGKLKAWHKGLTKETDERLKNLSESLKGNPIYKDEKRNKKISGVIKKLYNSGKLKCWIDGLTKETDERVRDSGIKQSETKKEMYKEGKLPKFIGAKGKNNLMYGKVLEKHPNWQGGISFEPYGLEFNDKLKEQIRQRDNYRCQQCFRHQDELYTRAGIKKCKLHIHHIDFNKQNNNHNNLISLCLNCHLQTNYNREDWTKYFQEKIIGGI